MSRHRCTRKRKQRVRIHSPLTLPDVNDAFRRGDPSIPGQRNQTVGVTRLPGDDQARIVRAMTEYSVFPPGDDPYGEHDFGCFEVVGIGLFYFKIDYYADDRMERGVDPRQGYCYRLLTLMTAEEY